MYCRAILALLVSYCVLQVMADINDDIMNVDPNNDAQVRAIFLEFKKLYNKKYANAAEEEKRFQIFRDNLFGIQKMNSNPNDTAKYGITQFTELTAEEMKQHNGFISEPE